LFPEQQISIHPFDSPIPSQSVSFTRYYKSFFFRLDQYRDGQKELAPICEENTDRVGRPINPAKWTVMKY
jgi:hypothetical protein